MNKMSLKNTAAQRLFVALNLSDKARARLEALPKPVPGLRWLSGANLHLTLRFLGQASAPCIIEALKAVRAERFYLRIQGLGLFQRCGRVIVWAGVAPSVGLFTLKSQIDRALLEGAGLAPEAVNFTPHITLARGKTPGSAAMRALLVNAGQELDSQYLVTSFMLFSSLLKPGGAKHLVEQEYLLA